MQQRDIDAAAQLLGVTNLVPLARGGQKLVATASRATDDVVLKLVELQGPHAAETHERARREVELLTRIKHPNVVELRSGMIELGTPPRVVAWLEQHLDGTDVRGLLGQPWPWDEVKRLLTDVLAGLDALHAQRVIHRDLSPGNVRRIVSGSYVILDPGLARWITLSTMTGPMDPGTLGYMSPEHVLDGVRPSAPSDLFELGILAYEALTGAVPIPFTGDRLDYMTRLRQEQAPSVGVVRSDLDPAQIGFIDRLLQRQLARRFISAQEATVELSAL